MNETARRINVIRRYSACFARLPASLIPAILNHVARPGVGPLTGVSKRTRLRNRATVNSIG